MDVFDLMKIHRYVIHIINALTIKYPEKNEYIPYLMSIFSLSFRTDVRIIQILFIIRIVFTYNRSFLKLEI